MARPKTSRANDARSRILMTALDAFANCGYDGISTTEIAKAAGVTQPLIHYHFKTKDALWYATVDYLFSILSVELRNIINDVLIERENNVKNTLVLRGFIEKLIDLSARFPSIHRFILREGTQHTERLIWLVENHMRALSDLLETMVFRPGVQNQRLKDLKWPQTLTMLIAAVTHSYAISPMMQVMFGIDPLAPEQKKNHLDALMQILESGLYRNIELIPVDGEIPDKKVIEPVLKRKKVTIK